MSALLDASRQSRSAWSVSRIALGSRGAARTEWTCLGWMGARGSVGLFMAIGVAGVGAFHQAVRLPRARRRADVRLEM